MFGIPAAVLRASANSGPSAVTIALIALAGVALGAILSTATQLFIAWRQSEREDSARRRGVVTAARMMAVDLSRARSNFGYCVDYHEWWRTTGLSPRVTADDRRIVLGELTPEGFYYLDRAEGAIDHWYGMRECELSQTPQYASLTVSAQRDKLREIIRWIDAVIEALRRLTGDPASIDPALGLGSPPQPPDPQVSID